MRSRAPIESQYELSRLRTTRSICCLAHNQPIAVKPGLHVSGTQGSLLTRRWRELDSNLRFRASAGSILPVKFVADSLLEGDGFELSVPPLRGVASSRRGEELGLSGWFSTSTGLWGTGGFEFRPSVGVSGPRVARPLAWDNGFPRLQRINARESLLSPDQPNLW
jgi:hypothetical protein